MFDNISGNYDNLNRVISLASISNGEESAKIVEAQNLKQF
jgi:hypothetical protein